MSHPPLTDYERYIRTEELLALQKPALALSCHDEMQFQIVHQVAELWMKLSAHEVARAVACMRAGDPVQATTTLGRVHKVQALLAEQLGLLDTMTSKDYMTIRGSLGRGSGQESPGFRRLLQLPEEMWAAFEALLGERHVTLRSIYELPDRQRELYALAEALLEFDQSLQLWRQRHLMLVYRQIGAGTPSLKGKASELLAEGLKHRFFPKLWEVRDELFAEWTKTHPYGAERGFHG
jgi:tryptophan 2,3-dioxygenase